MTISTHTPREERNTSRSRPKTVACGRLRFTPGEMSRRTADHNHAGEEVQALLAACQGEEERKT